MKWVIMNYDMDRELTLEDDVGKNMISESIERYPSKRGSVGETMNGTKGEGNVGVSALVIKTHDFEAAKKSLKTYSSQDNTLREISKVEETTCFGWLDHDVSGAEFNNLVTQIQGQFTAHKNLILGIINEFVEVYKAFESLDKDYIKGIVASINAAAEVSVREQRDRADIRRLVEGHEKAVRVLKHFKEEIEKIKHIADVDKAWETINEHALAIAELEKHRKGLARIAHLKDVDGLWEEVIKFRAVIASLEKHRKGLAEIAHLKDVDGLWDEVAKLRSTIASLERHRKILDGITHLNDVDKLWKQNGELQAGVAAVNQKFDGIETTLGRFEKSVADRFLQQTKRFEVVTAENATLCERSRILSRKLVAAIVMACLSGLISVSLFVLMLLKS